MTSTGLSKILVIGGTGYLGKYLVKESMKLGHPTYMYVRPITPDTNPTKVDLLKEFQSMGVITIQGELSEHEKLVSLVKQVDIVISALGTPDILEQHKILDAIKIAGNVKRFLPSEFGMEEEKVIPLPALKVVFDEKIKIRRATEAIGVPFTYLSSTCFGTYFLNFLLRPHPLDRSDELIIYGSGEAKVVFTCEKDMAIYAIKAANDPRTCNRTVFYRPPRNILSQLDVVALWEKKTGCQYKKIYLSEEEIVKLSNTSTHPHNVRMGVLHAIFVKGDTANFEISEEVTKLYPDVEYTTVDQILDGLLVNPPKFEYANL